MGTIFRWVVCIVVMVRPVPWIHVIPIWGISIKGITHTRVIVGITVAIVSMGISIGVTNMGVAVTIVTWEL